MRVTERRLTELVGTSLEKARTEVAKRGAELSSGIRVSRSSDDGVAWAEGARARVRLDTAAAHESAIGRSQERLQATEGALATIQDVLHRVTELAVQGSTASLTSGARIVLADEVRQLRAVALNAANSRASDGEYLLSSQAGLIPPFDAGTGLYSGGAIVRQVEAGAGLSLAAAVPGRRLEVTPGTTVFNVLDAVATALAANDAAGVAAQLDNLQSAGKVVAVARSEGGSYANALATADDARADAVSQLTSVLDRAVNTNVITAATELARAQNAIEAARAAGQQLLEMAALFR